MKKIRQPIISVLGHIDHGKTTLIDGIRGTLYHKKEAGGITQHIGATEVPKEIIERISKKFLDKFNFKIEIPGLLIIDTPGHEAFLSLRERGSSISDLAILVVDILQGVQEQTIESLKLLISYKVPFVVAATKIDLIPGWKPQNTYYFLESIQKQSPEVKEFLERKVYEIVSKLLEFNFDADLFYNVKDFRKTVAIIPVSGITKEGIAELLALVAALSQRFLKKKLEVDLDENAKGTILEVKEERGLGKVLDVILYDGILREGDLIAYPTIDEIKTSKIRAIFKPEPLKDIRFKAKLVRVKEVIPAAGVRLLVKDLDEYVLAGAPFIAIKDKKDLEKIKKELEEFRKKYIFTKKEVDGIVVKADTLGTLEGLLRLLSRENIPIRKAGIGKVNKEDVLEASSIAKKDRFLGVILAFNVEVPEDIEELAKKENVRIFKSNVIYKLVEDYKDWIKREKEKEIEEIKKKLVWPCKFKIIPGFVFRQHSPAIVGVEVLVGKLKNNVTVLRLKDLKKVGTVKSIQIERRSVSELNKGERGAVSIEGGYVGRNIKEGDELIVDIPEYHFRIIKEKFLNELSEEEKEILKLIVKYHREKNPTWGL